MVAIGCCDDSALRSGLFSAGFYQAHLSGADHFGKAHRPANKPMLPRYSRHYYDLALLARSTVRQEALTDLALLKSVVDFKQRFYPSAWAKYELANPGNFSLLPPVERYREVEKDYQAIQAMIFDKALAFAEIIVRLKGLEKEINAADRLI